jgi:uncharacterized protein YhaN
LNNFVDELTKRVETLKEIISNIDNKSIVELKLEINNSEDNKAVIEKSIAELEKLNSDNSSMSIYASIMAYQKELDSINKTIGKQTDDLEYLINMSCTLDNNVTNIEKKIAEKNAEISNVEREISLKSKLIDEKAKVNDENELNELEKELGYVEHRLKFKKTPQDIYNEIDCLLGSLDFDEPKKRTYTSRVEKNKNNKKRVKVVDVEEEPSHDIELVDFPSNFEKPEVIDGQDEVVFDDLLTSLGEK